MKFSPIPVIERITPSDLNVIYAQFSTKQQEKICRKFGVEHCISPRILVEDIQKKHEVTEKVVLRRLQREFKKMGAISIMRNQIVSRLRSFFKNNEIRLVDAAKFLAGKIGFKNENSMMSVLCQVMNGSGKYNMERRHQIAQQILSYRDELLAACKPEGTQEAQNTKKEETPNWKPAKKISFVKMAIVDRIAAETKLPSEAVESVITLWHQHWS